MVRESSSTKHECKKHEGCSKHKEKLHIGALLSFVLFFCWFDNFLFETHAQGHLVSSMDDLNVVSTGSLH